MLIHNINTWDGLTNGQQGIVVDVIASEERLQYVLVKFDNKNIGKQQRRKFRHLIKIANDIELVPIERFSFTYALGDMNKKHGAKASLIQFPLKLSWALTSHKCQGQTFSKPTCIYSDLNECFTPAQSYVILSRVTSPDQLFLKPFKHEKIYCHPEAKAEALRLNSKAINLQTTEWEKPGDKVVRISSLNVRSFPRHRQDLESDEFILNSDIVMMQETWLNEDPELPVGQFPFQHFVNGGSKGVGMLSSIKPVTIEKMQTSVCSLIKAEYEEFDIINIYRYSSTDIDQFLNDLEEVMCNTRTTIVVGDLNIDLLKSSENAFSLSMMRKNFQQLISNATHLKVLVI